MISVFQVFGRSTRAMRGAIFPSVALSLALHAGLAWFAARVVLPPRGMPSSPELTIALTALPAVAPAADRPPEAAGAMSPSAVAEAKPDSGVPRAETLSPQTAAALQPQSQTEAPPTLAAAADVPASVTDRRPEEAVLPIGPVQSGMPDQPGRDAWTVDAAAARLEGAPINGTAMAAPSAATESAPANVSTEITPVDVRPQVAPDPSPVAALEAVPSAAPSPPASVPDAAPISGELSQAATPVATAERLPAIAKPDTWIAEAAAVTQAPAAPTAGLSDRPAAVADGVPSVASATAQSLPLAAALAAVPGVTSGQAASVSPESVVSAKPDQPLVLESSAIPSLSAVPAQDAPPPAVPELFGSTAQVMASAEAEDPEAVAAIQRARSFIAGYDGGPCYALAAERVVEGTADVDGFAATRTAFDPFDAAFTAKLGYSPHVTGQVVYKPQCPAVDFLHHAVQGGARHPSLRLDNVTARSGGSVAGRVSDPSHEGLHLFWISEKGKVVDLSGTLVPNDEGARFRIDLPKTGGTASPQMLVALAGSVPPLPPSVRSDAATFFPALAATTANTPVGATAKLFLLGE